MSVVFLIHSSAGPDVLIHDMASGRLSYSVSGGDYNDYIERDCLSTQGSQLVTTDITDQHLYIINKKMLTQYVFAERWG